MAISLLDFASQTQSPMKKGIVQEITMEGVHAGPFETPMGTVQPTHKKFVGYGIQCFKVEDGKITEARLYYDQLDMMSQLGLIPAPAIV